MKIKHLIDVLQTYNPDHDIVISGHNGLGLGFDPEIVLVYQYDKTKYVLLVPGEEYREE